MINSPYVMHDQVRDLVPSLMRRRTHGNGQNRIRRLRTGLELGVFLLATVSYVGALSLMA